MMKQEEISAWAALVSGMLISEILGIMMRALNLDKYSLWVILFFYSLVIIKLAIEKDKLEAE